MKKLQVSDESRKKWENFWYYYKFHVLIGVFILICAVIFIRDMVAKVSYDYSIAFLGDTGILAEDQAALQKWFEDNGEDLNGDGEVHVQICDYSMPSEDQQGYNYQMFAASQTKFTVDIQSGQSMVFFISENNRERFQDQEVFSEEETAYKKASECGGFAEAGSPSSVKDLSVTMRLISQDSKQSKDPEIQKNYEVGEAVLKKFVEGAGK